jgi:hypothetical protein
VKLTVYLTVWPHTREGAPESFFAASFPNSSVLMAGERRYRAVIEIPDPVPEVAAVVEVEEAPRAVPETGGRET